VRISIIGSGHGGSAAAAWLAHNGHEVTVFKLSSAIQRWTPKFGQSVKVAPGLIAKGQEP